MLTTRTIQCRAIYVQGGWSLARRRIAISMFRYEVNTLYNIRALRIKTSFRQLADHPSNKKFQTEGKIRYFKRMVLKRGGCQVRKLSVNSATLEGS